jgi:hypothetical protein
VRRLLMSAANTGSQARRLQMEGQVRWPGGVGLKTAEGAGRRERQYANCGVPGPQRAGTLRYVGRSAPSPPLLHRAPWAQIPPGLSPSLDEARGSDQLRLPILTELLVPPRQNEVFWMRVGSYSLCDRAALPRRDAPTSPLMVNGSEMPSAGIALP